MEQKLITALTELTKAVDAHVKEASLTSAILLGVTQGHAEFILRQAAEQQANV